jgi:hypothetical protein
MLLSTTLMIIFTVIKSVFMYTEYCCLIQFFLIFSLGKYSQTTPDSLYACEPDLNHPFSQEVRIKLIAMMIEARYPGLGEPLKIRRYIDNGHIKGRI